MSRNWLILDTNGLCWRAFHTTGGLSYGNAPSGIAYGLLAEVLRLQERFQTEDMVFCFDHGKPLRAIKFKEYKKSRIEAKEKSEKEYRKKIKKENRIGTQISPKPESQKEVTERIQQEKYNQVRTEIARLRKELLPLAGYRNVFSQDGYEADDIIASVCGNIKHTDFAVVVSSDKDMLQLLSKQINVWRPQEKQLWTRESFRKTYGIPPKQWAWVKAMAGCTTDEVIGIKGVGEVTACKFMRGELKSGAKFDAITSEEGLKIQERNYPLVKLPYPGCGVFKPKPDTEIDLNPVYKRLGIKSLPGGIIQYKEK